MAAARAPPGGRGRRGRARWPGAPAAACALAAAAVPRGPGFALGALSRRALLGAAAGAAPALVGEARAAGAFENALPDVAKYSKRNAGSQPGDLGLQVRKLNRFDTTDGPALKECGPGPNCFSTTFDPEDVACSTALRPWSPPPGTPAAEALAQLREEIAGYPPGQNGVDGGGFRVITAQDNYLYAQFESLKKGRVDDTEFAVSPDGSVQVRSSGRIGRKADFGSNAKRLNYLSERLRARGWTAAEITKDTHEYYFRMNAGKTKTVCRGLSCPTNYELRLEPGDADD